MWKSLRDGEALPLALPQGHGLGRPVPGAERSGAGRPAADDSGRHRRPFRPCRQRRLCASPCYLSALAAVKGLFQFWMRVILIGISRDIEYDLRNDLFRHLVGLSPDYYARTRTGDIMARATNDLNAVRMMLGPGVMYWFETSLTFVLAIAIMLRWIGGWRCARSARAAGEPGGDLLRPRHSRAASSGSRRCSPISPAACRRTWRACAWCGPSCRSRPKLRGFEELNREYIAQKSGAGAASQGVFEPLLEALIGADVPGGAVVRRRAGAGAAAFPSAASSCSTPTWACWCGP